MTYNVIVTEEALQDLKKLLHSEQPLYKKALKLIGELYEHPAQEQENLSHWQAIVQGNGVDVSTKSIGWSTRFTTLKS